MKLFNGRPIKHIVILTGAGISAESGLATFRDSDGLWEKHDPMQIATPEAFRRDPDLVYRFYNARRAQLRTVHPNAAHIALASLQQQFHGDVFLVTQNVDDLHERGGSGQVCHMHGELNSMLCEACNGTEFVSEDFDSNTSCPLCRTPGRLRPDIVWFGEIPYHMDMISAQLRHCDLFISVGTSGLVYPAAGFVQHALAAGAQTIEINRELSEVTGCFQQRRQGAATTEMAALVEELLAG
jgi:NAD-dependent protein deacetylase/lipoamidase